MNKTEILAREFLVKNFRFADNRQAVAEFNDSLQESLDRYYLSICGNNRHLMPRKCHELEQYVSENCILNSAHELEGRMYVAGIGGIKFEDESEVRPYFSIFNTFNGAVGVILPTGIVTIENPVRVPIDRLSVCNINVSPNNNERVIETFQVNGVGYVNGSRTPLVYKNLLYYDRLVKMYNNFSTVVIQATVDHKYAVYHKLCIPQIAEDFPRISLDDTDSAYTWLYANGQYKGGVKFKDAMWLFPLQDN